MKFRILSKVDGFTDEKGIQHKPGDIVDLTDRYLKMDWLQSIEEHIEEDAGVSAVAPEKTQEEQTNPSKKQKRTSKRSKAQLDLSLI